MVGERLGRPADHEIYEKKWGMQSSRYTPGKVGAVNEVISRVFRQNDTDIVAFVEHWKNFRTEVLGDER